MAAEPEFRPSALLLGRAVQEALAVHHRGIQDGSPVQADQVISTFDDALRRELEHPMEVQYRNGETPEQLGTVGRALVAAYVTVPLTNRIVAVERSRSGRTSSTTTASPPATPASDASS